jgi:hypothetical protein
MSLAPHTVILAATPLKLTRPAPSLLKPQKTLPLRGEKAATALQSLRRTQAHHELAEFPLGGLVQGLFEGDAVLVVVLPLDARQVGAVPVQADEAGDQQFVAELVVLVVRGDVLDGVLEEEGVARGFVDDAVEDVGYDFALFLEASVSVSEIFLFFVPFFLSLFFFSILR